MRSFSSRCLWRYKSRSGAAMLNKQLGRILFIGMFTLGVSPSASSQSSDIKFDNPNHNFEHCIKENKYPPNPYSSKFPKGYKKVYNACSHQVFMGHCLYPMGLNPPPPKKKECGFNGKHLQGGWTLKPGAEYAVKWDIYRRYDVKVCKGKTKSSFVFKVLGNTASGYYCQ